MSLSQVYTLYPHDEEIPLAITNNVDKLIISMRGYTVYTGNKHVLFILKDNQSNTLFIGNQDDMIIRLQELYDS